MARPGITYQEVAAAADSIVAAGENPTIQRVRAALGTGSPNTIHKHLTAWRDAAPIQERKAPELPADLQAAIVRELERQSAEARAELEKQLIQTRAEAAELAGTGEQLETDMDELTERNQSLSDECQGLRALTEERAQEIGKLEADLTREREAAETVRVQLAQALNKVESQGERITDLAAEVKEIRAELTQATAAKIAAEQAAAVSEAKLESTRERLAESQATGQKVTQALEKAQVEAGDAIRQMHDWKTQAQEEMSQNALLKSDLEHLKAKLSDLQKALDQKTAEAADALTEAAELRGQLKTLNTTSFPTAPEPKAPKREEFKK